MRIFTPVRHSIFLRAAVAICLIVVIGGIALVTLAQQVRICAAAELPVTFEGAWHAGAEMPTPRSEIAAAVLDGKIYVAGGLARSVGGNITTPAFEVYDIEDNSWSEAAPLPIALHHTSIAAYDGAIYLAGGYTDLSFTPTDRAWRYDPEADVWSEIAPLPSPNGAHMLVALNDYLYLVGGTPAGDTLWRYDPAADAWEDDLAPLPTPREHLGAAALGNFLYVAGGRWNGNTSALERYDPAEDAWETLDPMPTARGGFSIAGLDGRIYAAGGEDFVGAGCTFNRAEVYDPETDRWERLPDMPTPRHGITSVAVDGRWYVIGGATGAGAATFLTATGLIEIFTPAS